MKTYIKYGIIGLIILAVGVVIGAREFSTITMVAASPSPSGTTFSTEKISTVEVTTVSTSTIASLPFNGTDAILTSSYCYFSGLAGVGTDNGKIGIKAATSTIQTGNVGSDGNANTNYIVNGSLSTTSIPGFNWFRNPLGSATTTAVVGNAAGSALASSTLQVTGGGVVFVNFIADEPLAAGTTGICGVNYNSL